MFTVVTVSVCLLRYGVCAVDGDAQSNKAGDHNRNTDTGMET